MNKVNFDSLKNIKAPEAWLKKAAAIPETPVKERAFPAPYRVAAAASLVLVSVIGLLVFLVHQGTDGVVVAPNGNHVDTQAATDSITANDDTAETSAVPSLIGSIFPTEQIYPTNAQGQRVTEAAIAPTSSATAPSTAIAPVQKPTYRPTEPVGADSTEVPIPTTVPTNPPAPPAPPETQEPTSPYRPPSNSEIYCTVSLEPVPSIGDGSFNFAKITVFCCLYDASGHLVGDAALFSPKRKAKILSVNSDDSLLVMYDPVEMGFYIQAGWYEYVFYDDEGTELYRSSTYIY